MITIEGAAATKTGKALQNAFVVHGGAQCGICTPGMILAAAPLKTGASLDEIKTALAGNLCRCTGYPAIFRSVDVGAEDASGKARVPVAVERAGARAAALAEAGACRCWRAIPALTPIAGCTDVYVGLHFGTLSERRFIDLWDLKELRGISVEQRRAAHRRAHDLYRDHRVEDRAEARADARGRVARSRRRADPESRHARRQRRQCLAGRRHAARAGRRERAHRPPQSAVDADGGVRQLLHRLSQERAAAGRADRRDRDSAHRRRAVVAKGRHPARAGDLEDHDRAACAAATCASPSDRSRRRSCSRRQAAAVLSGGGSIADAQAALRTEIAPIDDVRSTGEYRAKVAANLLAQFWKETA